MVAVKLAVVLAFILHRLGLCLSRPTGIRFIPENTGEFGQFGWSGVLRGAAVVFFAFIGFDAVSTAAQEAQEPAARHADRHPGLAGHLHGALHRRRGGAHRPRALSGAQRRRPDRQGVDVIGLTWFSVLIKIGALAGLTTVILVLLYGQSRIFFTIAHDGLLPPVFAQDPPGPQNARGRARS